MLIKSILNYENTLDYSIVGIFKNKKIIKLCTLGVIFIISLFMFNKIFIENFNIDYNNNLLVADFRTDINKLWETSLVIESYRVNNKYSNTGSYGTEEVRIKNNQISLDLKKALVKIADRNGDVVLSNNEISDLGLMHLKSDVYSKELKNLQFYNLSLDNNLKHYLIITKGEYKGTILYNGSLEFVDSSNKRYFGVELFSLDEL